MLKPREDEVEMQDEVADDELGVERHKGRHRRYRAAKKSTHEELQRVKDELEAAVQVLVHRLWSKPPTPALSWKNIATALKESRDESYKENRDLRAKVYIYNRMKQELCSWAELTRSLNPMGPTWRDTTLLAHPESRRLGKEWIVQRMFHNTDRVFQQHGFPPWNDGSVDMWCDPEIRVTETGFEGKIRRHFATPSTFEATTKFVRENCLAALFVQDAFGQARREVDANTQLHTVVTRSGELVNILFGEFHQGPDRCTFVLRQINHDDGQPGVSSSHRQRCRMCWFDYIRLPGGRTRKRVLSVATNCKANDQAFNIDAEAKLVGLSLENCPDHAKEARLQQHLLDATRKLLFSIESTMANK